MSKPLYDNCALYSQDDIILGYCNLEKYNWYINRGLGEEIGYKKLRLNYTPKNWEEYAPNMIKKKNICVNCGTTEDLTRHHIIPKCYIKYFPLEIKTHNSHDVALMCRDCHAEYEEHAVVIKRKYGEMYNAPLDFKRYHVNLFKAYSCLMQLLHYERSEKWKENRMILNMMYTVESYMPETNYSQEDLKKLRNDIVEVKKQNHGKNVMKNITDYQSFAEMWRNHFIETMEPAFMPEGWDIKTKLPKWKIE